MGGQGTATRSRVTEVVRGLAEELHPGIAAARLGNTADLERDLGFGSLERLELLRRLEAAFGRRLPDRPIFQARTLADLLRALEATAGPPVPEESAPAHPLAPSGTALRADSARTLGEVLALQARAAPDGTWLRLLDADRLDRDVGFGEVADLAARYAGGLYHLGVTPGDRVALMLPTGLEFFGAFFGALWAGAVPVPLYPPVRPDELEEYVHRQGLILANAEPRALVADGPARPVAQLLRRGVPLVSTGELARGSPAPLWPGTGGELAMLQYTSGSTGVPKGVALPHDRMLANVRAYGQGVDVQPDDLVVSWLPLYHDMGLIGAVLGTLYHGIPLALMSPLDFLGRPARWLWALHRYGGTISAAPNFAYEICARRVPDDEIQGLDLSRWRLALNGSEAVRPETLERFSQRFAPFGFREAAFFPAYGLAESSVALAFPPVGRPPRVDRVSKRALQERRLALPAEPGEPALRFVSCGQAVAGMQLRIEDPQGAALEDRHQGRVLFRGTSAMAGYYMRPEATAAVRDDQGWIDSGDLGYLAEGELHLTGRSRDLILKGGRNLYPEDLETLASEVSGVRRGCVMALGVPSPSEGTDRVVILAESRTRDRAERARIEAGIRDRVTAGVGLPPDEVRVVPPRTLPKTPSGKLRRSACRERLLAGTLEGTGGIPWRLALPALVQASRRLGEAAWVAWGWTAVAACAAPVAAFGLAGRQAPGWMARGAARGVLRALGIRLEVEGRLEPSGPLVVVANHSSMLDGAILAAALDRDLVFATAPWVPRDRTFGAVVRSVGHVVVSRGDPDSATREVENLAEVLRAGECLAAFPEGGYEAAPGLRPFAMGVFLAACEAGVPVIPVAVAGSRRALPPEVWVPRPGVVRVTVAPPLVPGGAGWSPALALARQAREAIAAGCGEPLVERRMGRSDPVEAPPG